MVVIGRMAYVTINFDNAVYQVDLGTGEYSRFVTDLDYPTDLVLVPAG